MFITVAKRQDDRYIFAVGDDMGADPRSWVRSDSDAAVLGDIPSSFDTFGEAHAFASRLADERPSCVRAKKAMFYAHAREIEDQTMSAEAQTISHYNEQVKLVGRRVFDLQGIDRSDMAEETAAVKKEIMGIKGELDRIAPMVESDSGREKMGDLTRRLDSYLAVVAKFEATKTAAAAPFPIGLPRSAIRVFAEAAMLGMASKHPDVFVKSASAVPATRQYEVTLASPSEGDIVRLAFDRNLLLTDVIPCGVSLERCGGRHSPEFLVGYWEPIVEAVGHFHSQGNGVVAVASSARPRRYCYPGFSMSDNSPASLLVVRAEVLGKESWLVKKSVMVTNPIDSGVRVNDEVVCVNPRLPTYKDGTGVVIRAIQRPSHVEYEVDFRRGIGLVRLEDKDIRKVELGG